MNSESLVPLFQELLFHLDFHLYLFVSDSDRLQPFHELLHRLVFPKRTLGFRFGFGLFPSRTWASAQGPTPFAWVVYLEAPPERTVC